ncbi:Holliday junction resolvase [Zostera marina]|uniref:Holliday junction resolvase n=1 Tax=Zostera marina TaxID=29655 RepID=A0A0K9PV52_ZOSMR|nr:Holliday junction resolvase [Zostera marina]
MAVLFLPNALRRKNNPNFRGGFSLGVDLGDARTGVAIGKGFSSPRPHSVLEFKGQKLEMRIVEIAEREEIDEFIIGLPRSFDGKETAQSNKVRSIAGRLAIRAAERGWPVYLQDENGTSIDALDFMINIGIKKQGRQRQIDAYSAMMVLERYFSSNGDGAQLVLPKQPELQQKLQKKILRDEDILEEDFFN